MDTLGQIKADTIRSRQEAINMIAAIEAGTATLAPGMTPSKAIAILRENIAQYDAILSRMRGGHADA